MRKLVIGVIIGVVLSYSGTAFAEAASLIGKAIEGVFSVQIDGKKLEKEALVVDGTTYLPVRAFGEALGYEVAFDSELGVSMTKKVDTEKAKKLDEIKTNAKIQAIKDDLKYWNDRKQGFERDLTVLIPGNEAHAADIDIAQKEVEKAKTEIERLENELAEIEAQQ